MGLQPSPSFRGTPPPTTSPQQWLVTPPAALPPTTPPPIRQQGATTPANTPVAQSRTDIDQISALVSQLNISIVADTDPKNANLLKSPSAHDQQHEQPTTAELSEVARTLFPADEDDAADNIAANEENAAENYEAVIEFITNPQNQNNAPNA